MFGVILKCVISVRNEYEILTDSLRSKLNRAAFQNIKHFLYFLFFAKENYFTTGKGFITVHIENYCILWQTQPHADFKCERKICR